MGTEGSGASRAGGEGWHNEDAFLVEDGLGLYVVCDGASGTPAGEIAARTAARAVEEFVEGVEEDLDFRTDRIARAVVEEAMDHALRAVGEAARREPELEGLATTVTVLLAHGRLGVIGHRGDSRAYLIRRERARQLTFDDDATEASSSGRNRDPHSDVFSLDLQPGDTLVLCTDGAEEVVQSDEIVRVSGDLAPHVLASRIVSAAHRRAPDQDATAVVVRVRGDAEPGWLELSSEPDRTAFGHVIPLAEGSD
ncbi:MAG: PP2C family protein-serine/threonine phosphatase [Myxococcota bacterium]